MAGLSLFIWFKNVICRDLQLLVSLAPVPVVVVVACCHCLCSVETCLGLAPAMLKFCQC